MIFEADEELRQMRRQLAEVEARAVHLREQLHARILQMMRAAGMLDRRTTHDRRAPDRRRTDDRRTDPRSCRPST